MQKINAKEFVYSMNPLEKSTYAMANVTSATAKAKQMNRFILSDFGRYFETVTTRNEMDVTPIYAAQLFIAHYTTATKDATHSIKNSEMLQLEM